MNKHLITRFNMTTKHFAELRTEVAADAWTPKRRDGWDIGTDHADKLAGRYIYPKVVTIEGIDPETLAPKADEHRVHLAAPFTIHHGVGVMLTAKATDRDVVIEAIGEYAGIECQTSPLNFDFADVWDAMCEADEMQLHSIRVGAESTGDGLLEGFRFRPVDRDPESALTLIESHGYEVLAVEAIGKTFGKILVKAAGTVSCDDKWLNPGQLFLPEAPLMMVVRPMLVDRNAEGQPND